MRASSKTGLLILAFMACILLFPDVAYASGAGGSMPWDTPLTTLRNNLTGPFAYTLALVAFVVAGSALIFGGQISDFIRSLFFVILVASILVGINAFMSTLGLTGALI